MNPVPRPPARAYREGAEGAGFLPLIKRWWPLLLISACLAGVAAYVASSRATPTYEADVKILVGPIRAELETLRASGQLAQTYAELAESRPLVQATAKQLRMPAHGKLSGGVRASANEVTRILRINVRSSEAALAARFANTLADKLSELTTVRRAPGETDPATRAERQLRVIEPATAPSAPVAPRVLLIVVLATIAGLLSALALALMFDRFRSTVSSEQELATLSHAPVLGSTYGARRALSRSRVPVLTARPGSHAAEAYRLLATKIESSNGIPRLRTLLVVGTQDGDGSGELAANLALALAEAGAQVVLVDANGEVTHLFDLIDRPGLGELLQNGSLAEPGTAVLSPLTSHPRVDVVPRGTPTADSQPIPFDRAKQVVNRLATPANVIVVDAAPLGRSSSSLVWARAADATVLVVHRGQTKRQNVTDAVDSLHLVGAHVIGTVLNQGQRPRSRR